MFPDLWGPLPGSDVAAGLFSLSNWQAIHLADAGEPFRLLGPLGVFWSLALEEQFYLGLFAVVMISMARAHAMTSWLVGLLVAVGLWSVASLVLIDATPQREFFGTDTRASELVAGCLLAVWVHHHGLPTARVWRWLGPLALVVAFAAWSFVHEDDPWVLGGGLALFSVVNIGLILGASVNGPMAAVLALAPLGVAGAPQLPAVPGALADRVDHAARTARHGRVAPHRARFVVSVFVAWMVFRFLENPLRISTLCVLAARTAVVGRPCRHRARARRLGLGMGMGVVTATAAAPRWRGRRAAAGTERSFGLDVCRALAAVGVLVTHVAFVTGVVNPQRWSSPLRDVLPRLDVGVTIFFVLSGLLVGRPFVGRTLAGAPPADLRRYGDPTGVARSIPSTGWC